MTTVDEVRKVLEEIAATWQRRSVGHEARRNRKDPANSRENEMTDKPAPATDAQVEPA